jgi:hypothetical protein
MDARSGDPSYTYLTTSVAARNTEGEFQECHALENRRVSFPILGCTKNGFSDGLNMLRTQRGCGSVAIALLIAVVISRIVSGSKNAFEKSFIH